MKKLMIVTSLTFLILSASILANDNDRSSVSEVGEIDDINYQTQRLLVNDTPFSLSQSVNILSLDGKPLRFIDLRIGQIISIDSYTRNNFPVATKIVLQNNE